MFLFKSVLRWLLDFREGEATASKHSNGAKGTYNQRYNMKGQKE